MEQSPQTGPAALGSNLKNNSTAMCVTNVSTEQLKSERKVKYNRDNPNKGMKIWILGLVDR